MLAFLTLIFFSSFSLASESETSTKPTTKILVSITPYALILKELEISGIEIAVLQEAAVNPHAFQMKPSHLKKIAEADLVIWGGKNLEPYLAKALSNNKRQLVLEDIPDLSLLQDSHHGHDDDHNTDPHIWLSEKNKQAIAQAMKKVLEPEVSTESQIIKTELSGEKVETTESKQKPMLLVHHNAYAYLEAELGFQHDFVIFDNHNAKPGLKHWHELNQQLQEAKSQNRPLCFISSPAFTQSVEAGKLQRAVHDAGLGKNFRWEIIDPMASDKKYKGFSEHLAESRQSMLECMRN